MHRVFVEKQTETVGFLDSEPGVELIVKRNPRGVSEEQADYLDTIRSKVVGEENVTPELISWADVIVGGGTSVMVDPITRGKTVIATNYLDPVTYVYEDYGVPWIVYSLDEFKKCIQRLKKDRDVRTYAIDKEKFFIDEFVYGGDDNHSVLDRYADFIMEKSQKKIEHQVIQGAINE